MLNSLLSTKPFGCSLPLVLLFLFKIFRLQVFVLVFEIASCLMKPGFAANRTPFCASVKLRRNCCYWDLFWGCLVTSGSRAGKWGRQQVGELCESCLWEAWGNRLPFLPVPCPRKYCLCKVITNQLIWFDGQRDV